MFNGESLYPAGDKDEILSLKWFTVQIVPCRHAGITV